MQQPWLARPLLQLPKKSGKKNVIVATMVGLTCQLSPSPHCLLPSPGWTCLLQGQPLQFVLDEFGVLHIIQFNPFCLYSLLKDYAAFL